LKTKEFEQIEKMKNDVRINFALTDQTTYFKANATTPIERLALRLKVKEAFSDVLNDPKLGVLEAEYEKEKRKIEKEKQAKEEQERKKWLEEYNQPINSLIRLLRSRYHQIDPSHLEDWANQLTRKQLEEVFQEYKVRMKRNGLPLTEEATNWGYHLLFSLLNKRESQKEKRTCFHNELHGIIENEFKNAQKLADFIIKTSERQEQLLTQLETLTQTIQELLKAINKKGKPTYAT